MSAVVPTLAPPPTSVESSLFVEPIVPVPLVGKGKCWPLAVWMEGGDVELEGNCGGYEEEKGDGGNVGD